MPRRRASSGECSSTGWPSKRISPAVGLVHAGQRLDQRRLAGAVVADERDDLVGVDGEARAAQRADAAEALDDLLGFEQGLGHQAGSFSMADTAGRSSALAKSPAATPDEQRGAAAAGLDDGRRLDGAEAALGVEHGGVARPAAGDDDLVCGPATASMWAISACDLARRPCRSRRATRRPARRRAAARGGRSSECSSSSSAGASPGAMASAPALSSSRSAGPSWSSTSRRARPDHSPASSAWRPCGHVPADGHAACDAAPARGGVLRRGDAHERLGGPARVEHVAGRDHADADAGDEVVVAGHGQHGALGAGQGGAVAAPGVGAGEDELGEQRRRAGPAHASASA